MTCKFILAEKGATPTSLGLLTFDATGAVARIEYLQASGITQSAAVSGTYAIAADGSGTHTLSTLVASEDGLASAIAAVHDFLAAKTSGFVAIRRDSATATVAEVIPASAAASFAVTYVLADEGLSPSGQIVAEIGLLTMKADGSLSGRAVLKQNGASTAKSLEGSYVADGSGFGLMKLASPSAADEDGGVVMQTTAYVFLATVKQELNTLRTDNSLLGLGRIEPMQ